MIKLISTGRGFAFVSVLFILILLVASAASADQWPKKIKTRGKPKVARWEDVDKVLARLEEVRAALSDRRSLTFADLFLIENDEVLFPLTHSVLKHADEAGLNGLPVFTRAGEELGRFAGKYVYEKRGGTIGPEGYDLTYFQYNDKQGRLQVAAAGPYGPLLDNFCLRWGDIKFKTLGSPGAR